MKTRFSFLITIFIMLVASVQAQDVSGDLLGRINGLRNQLGLTPYTVHPSLVAAAQNHANWMIETGEVTHVQYDGSSPANRAAAAGYVSPWVSENIYMGGLAGVDTAWTFWVNSSVHYAGLTSPNYQHIGIATAQGSNGQAFVLVFGAGAGTAASVSAGNRGNGGTSAGNDEAAPPPSYIVGVDGVGNIMHEIQAGHTLGDVLLLYGYTWDDLPALMELNELTDADIRALDVGQIILVPPQSGTYTPTAPSAEATTEATEPAESTAEVTEAADGVIPTPLEASPTDRINEAVNGIIPTPIVASPTNRIEEASAGNGLLMPATFVAPQTTPTAQIPTATQTLAPTLTPQQSLRVSTVAAVTPVPDVPVQVVEAIPTTRSNRPPLWLIGAIGIQVGVLGFASFEFFRRNR